MKTITKVAANIDDLQFGYWDSDQMQFVPVTAIEVDELKQAVSALKCSEELLDALAMFAANISEAIGDDLRDIWKRLD